jgi:hypothetical protein
MNSTPAATVAPPPTTPAGVSNLQEIDQNTQATSNGLKILGEFVALPGISLLAEGRVGEGALYAGLGVLGGWLGGLLLGPLGYLMVRYGASAASYYASFQQPSTDAQQAAQQQQLQHYLTQVAHSINQQYHNIALRLQDLDTRVTALTPTPTPTAAPARGGH